MTLYDDALNRNDTDVLYQETKLRKALVEFKEFFCDFGFNPRQRSKLFLAYESIFGEELIHEEEEE